MSVPREFGADSLTVQGQDLSTVPLSVTGTVKFGFQRATGKIMVSVSGGNWQELATVVGTGGVTFETPAGTIDGSNKSFTMTIALGAKDRVEIDGLFDNSPLGVGTALTVNFAPVSYIKIWRIS